MKASTGDVQPPTALYIEQTSNTARIPGQGSRHMVGPAQSRAVERQVADRPSILKNRAQQNRAAQELQVGWHIID